jgi:serine protease AprX
MRKAHSPAVVILFSVLLVLHSSISTLAGISFTPGQGVMLAGADGVMLEGADSVMLTGAEGVMLAGADGVMLEGADCVQLVGADALTYTGVDEVVPGSGVSTGIRSVDAELAWLLNTLPDSSAVNVFLVFHRMPAASDFDSIRAAGIFGGTIFNNLPMVLVNATKSQVTALSTLPSVRTIYSNKTFEFFTHDTRILTGETKVTADRRLTQRNGGMPLSGQGVTVAVLDTGIDATHPDLGYGSQVIQNVRVADLQGSSPTFLYPQIVEGLNNSDPVMGHGTFVAGVIAGTGSASGGYYGGMAPGARLLGISGGDASLFFVLSGMDYILSHRADMNVRVVNCSFGIAGLFDSNDPVNIATKILHDAGISVVFSAGNRGDQPNSLNPYSVAPWVLGVGSVNKSGSLSSFSSRGAAGYGLYHPTLVAPGESVVSARASGVNVVGTSGLSAGLASPDNDVQVVPSAYLPRYTCSSGTSFAAPQVAGTIALMLQANPRLTVDQISQILQRTATPMLAYSRYEVGAGNLNTYAAVRQAAFGASYGAFRTNLSDSGVSYTREHLSGSTGTVAPGSSYSTSFNVPADALFATVEVAWLQNGSAVNLIASTLSGPSYTTTLPSPGLLGLAALKKTGVTLTDPSPGLWTINITNNTADPTGTAQQVVIAVEVFRARYSLTGLNQLSSIDRAAATRALRTGLMSPLSGDFAANSYATRLDLARALTLGAGARVPQYLPDSPSFSDAPRDFSAVFIESVSHSPFGDLMGTTGSVFNPQARIDRTSVAMALVKTLGLDQEAQAAAVTNPGLADWNLIPAQARGYVSVAISHNLMRAPSGYFRPMDSITRLGLAATAVALQQATR